MPRGAEPAITLMRTVQFENNALRLIDQTKLPNELVFVTCTSADDVAEAIRGMKVRGAPAIGISAAYGLVLGAREYAGRDPAGLLAHLERVAQRLKATRPTAVNLSWAVDRLMAAARDLVQPARLDHSGSLVERVGSRLLELADHLADEDVSTNRQLGALGASLIQPDSRVLTHCNAGALACVDYGTAIGVIRSAAEHGKRVRVFVDETRPFLQGARLTAWELQQAGIPVTLITDSMAGHFIARGEVDVVVVGADRVAANGDVANKIGTYALAVLCKEHEVPFYVAAPTSSIDLRLPSGAEIPIEERSPDEVTHFAGQRIAPPGVEVANPAFDVTPARFVTAIITERGICRPPYEESLRRIAAAEAPAPEATLNAERSAEGQSSPLPGRTDG